MKLCLRCKVYMNLNGANEKSHYVCPVCKVQEECETTKKNTKIITAS